MAPSRGRVSASELDLQPVLEIRYRRTETWMEDMSAQLRHEHDTAFQEWLEEARKKERPKRPGKKCRKAKQSKRSAKGRCDVWQQFLSAQLERSAKLRWVEQEDRIVNQVYCQIMGVTYEKVKKNQVAKLVELRMQYEQYNELRGEILERELFPAYRERLQRKIEFKVRAECVQEALKNRERASEYTEQSIELSLIRLNNAIETYVGNSELKELAQQGVRMAWVTTGSLRETWLDKSEDRADELEIKVWKKNFLEASESLRVSLIMQDRQGARKRAEFYDGRAKLEAEKETRIEKTKEERTKKKERREKTEKTRRQKRKSGIQQSKILLE